MISLATQDAAGNITTKPVKSADIVILGAGYGGQIAESGIRTLKLIEQPAKAVR